MDGLSEVMARAEAFDAEADAVPDYAQEEKRAEAGSADSAANAADMAESVLKVGEAAVKMIVDPRLSFSDEIDPGREALAPVIDKYGLAVGGGKIPYSEEIAAGFFMGGLFKRSRAKVSALWASDKANESSERGANEGGDKREAGQEEPEYAVSGNERIREKPDVKAEKWNTEAWG